MTLQLWQIHPELYEGQAIVPYREDKIPTHDDLKTLMVKKIHTLSNPLVADVVTLANHN